MSRHVPSSVGPMLGSGICHRNRGGGCWSPFRTRYLSVTSNTSKHKTALVLVFERKIPSIAPYLALQENTEMSCRRKSHMEGEWRQRGSASLAFVELWARICSQRYLAQRGQARHHNPLEKAGLGGPTTAVHMVPRFMCLQLLRWVSLKLGLGR